MQVPGKQEPFFAIEIASAARVEAFFDDRLGTRNIGDTGS